MSITDRARAEAERILEEATEAIGIPHREQIRYAEGFAAGAEWAASQPVTDEEVRAAAWAICRIQDGDYDPTEPDPCRGCTEEARAALTAAREAQR